jgi:hypothetical protein
MKKYLLFTPDGFTQDMEGADTENCQVLGCAAGRDLSDAVKRFRDDNNWINGYKYESIHGYELKDDKEITL